MSSSRDEAPWVTEPLVDPPPLAALEVEVDPVEELSDGGAQPVDQEREGKGERK